MCHVRISTAYASRCNSSKPSAQLDKNRHHQQNIIIIQLIKWYQTIQKARLIIRFVQLYYFPSIFHSPVYLLLYKLPAVISRFQLVSSCRELHLTVLSLSTSTLTTLSKNAIIIYRLFDIYDHLWRLKWQICWLVPLSARALTIVIHFLLACLTRTSTSCSVYKPSS